MLYICTINFAERTMKPYKCMPKVLLLSFLMALASGCGLVGSYDSSAYEHIFLEEEAHLTPDASSPFCDFSIDYTYLNEEDDSIAALINRSVQREFLGKEFATLVPEVAVWFRGQVRVKARE